MGSMISKQSRVDNGGSKTLMHHLPEEIIEEILFNLPAKSLLRFKCVSKQWRSLISSKRFIKRHLAKKLSSTDHHKLIILHPDIINRSFTSCSLRSLHDNSTITASDHNLMDHIPMMMTSASSDNADYFTFRRHYNLTTHYPMMMKAATSASSDDDDDGQYYPRRNFLLAILGSCNGLILITIDTRDLFIWNPTTRQSKKIPPPESHGFSNDDVYRGGSYRYGFGYDETTKDYKIASVFVSYKEKQKTTTTEMYSLRTNSWKKIDSFEKRFMYDWSGKFRDGKFVNGKLHWLTHPEEEDYGCWGIVALDLAQEKYEVVGRPQYFSDHDTDIYRQPRLHEVGGYLGLTCFNEKHDTNVWVMTKYGETDSWVKVLTFSHKMTSCGAFRGVPCPLRLTTTIENGDHIVVCFAVSTGLCVVVYNGSNHNVLHTSRVDLNVDPTDFDIHFEANMYVESLVSPFGDDEQEQL